MSNSISSSSNINTIMGASPNKATTSRIQRLNDKLTDSSFGEWFHIRKRGSTFFREILGGVVSFLTIAYIIPVNGSILADTGGPCPELYPDLFVGDVEFDVCVNEVRYDLITATMVVSALTTLLMGVWVNVPLTLAPGMGMNAYFAYSVVGYMGSGSVSYRTAITAVFLEGIIFFLLAITGMRSLIRKILSSTLQAAVACGIGLFIAHIGLQGSNGIGLTTFDSATLVTLGGCKLEDRIFLDGGSNYSCEPGSRMNDPQLWVSLVAAAVMSYGLSVNFSPVLFVVIIVVSALSWFRGTTITSFPDTAAGDEAFDYFKQIISFHSIKRTLGLLKFDELGSKEVWIALVTLLYTDLLDTTGAATGLCTAAQLKNPDGTLPSERALFSVDALGTVMASLFGCSPVTCSVESMGGIAAGARTGFASVVTGCLFLLGLVFAPVFASIPPMATGPVLIVVGSLMMSNITRIDWQDSKKAFPAFLTIVLMPLLYSVAYALIAGIMMSFMVYIFYYAHQLLAGNMSFVEVLVDCHVMPADRSPDSRKCSMMNKSRYEWLECYGLHRCFPDIESPWTEKMRLSVSDNNVEEGMEDTDSSPLRNKADISTSSDSSDMSYDGRAGPYDVDTGNIAIRETV